MNATQPTPPTAAQMRTRSPVQLIALLYGCVFIVVGVAGFIPAVTMDFEAIEMGSGSRAMLLGLFQVSFLHNVIHLLFGLAGLAFSRNPSTARGYLLVGGIIYALMWIFGLAIDKDSMANFVPLNSADDWLHFVLALTKIGLSFLPRGR